MTIPPVRRPQPPVAQSTTATAMTEQEKEQKALEIINGAPLQTNPDDATHPPVVEEKVKAARPLKAKVKPWRVGFQDRPASDLMQLKSKTSFTQIKELELRMDFILSEANNSRGLGAKVYMNQLILEALDEYTIRKLKELGYDVD